MGEPTSQMAHMRCGCPHDYTPYAPPPGRFSRAKQTSRLYTGDRMFMPLCVCRRLPLENVCANDQNIFPSLCERFLLIHQWEMGREKTVDQAWNFFIVSRIGAWAKKECSMEMCIKKISSDQFCVAGNDRQRTDHIVRRQANLWDNKQRKLVRLNLLWF